MKLEDLSHKELLKLSLKMYYLLGDIHGEIEYSLRATSYGKGCLDEYPKKIDKLVDGYE